MGISESFRFKLSANKYVISCFLFVIVLVVSVYLVKQNYALRIQESESTAKSLLSAQSAQIERNLTRALMPTYVLAKKVRDNGGVIANFDLYAYDVLRMLPGAKNLQLAPDGITQYVYPLVGNEKIIGHNILADKKRNSEALKAINTGSLTLAGPFKLIQGGFGMVGRNPIFFEVDHRTTFWGFATALVLLDDLLEQTEFCKLLCDSYNYELGKVDPQQKNQITVFALGGAPLSSNALSKEIVVPNGTWILRIESKNKPIIADRVTTYGFCLLLAVLVSYAGFVILKEPEKLRSLVHQQTRELKELAYKDPLTGLPNRRMFCETLRDNLSRAPIETSGLKLLLIDLDRFKTVNDTLGHAMGDQLLCSVSSRLLQCLPDSAYLARLGGDEFTVILSGSSDDEDGDYYAASIINALNQSFSLGGNVVYVSGCIGIATTNSSTTTHGDLFKQADLALYEAKSKGSGRFEYFSERILQQVERTTKLTNELITAIQNDELKLLYQPISSVPSGRVEKAEALLRWYHPELGVISPLEVIPLAERSGAIVDMGLWIFRTAATQVKMWHSLGYSDIQISINVSPVQLVSRGQIDAWFEILDDLELDGSGILIELTEGVLLEGNSEIERIFERLQEKGIELALDDFGTGYSSMAYLRQFDIDYIKIDRSFVQNLPKATEDLVLCQAIIALASKLDLRVVAEGVETDDQRRLLANEGCDFIQGYYLSKPIDAQSFESLFLSLPINQNEISNENVIAFRTK